jgi:hypothetical protein
MPSRPRLRLAAVILTLAAPAAAQAQEPLFLRIRPFSPEAAFAAREAVWTRSHERARIAIASVCTGCLLPVRTEMPAEMPPDASHFAETGAP